MTRRERLAQARLYLIGDGATLERVLGEALAGGVDVVQIRSRSTLRADALATAARCQEAGALFIVNNDPWLAMDVDADGVHVGQGDVSVAAARKVVGEDRLVGLSTHSPEQIERAAGVDYIGVGPVWATPTKPGYAPVGRSNVAQVFAAGGQRVAVVRAIGEAADPLTAASALRQAAGIVNA